MDNRQVISSKSFSGELIGRFILFTILFSIIWSLLSSIILNRIPEDSVVLKAIVAIIFQGIFLFLSWRFSISSAFKKKTINKHDVNTVFKYILIFTIIIYCISLIANFINVRKTAEEAVNSDTYIVLIDTYIKYHPDDEKVAEYKQQKEELINKVSNLTYTYLLISEIGLLIVYLISTILQKKSIAKFSVEI